MFSPDLSIGEKIRNADIATIFECSNVGNMRLSRMHDALIVISDFTKGNYHDKWIDGVLHFTGYGKKGDQDIHRGQNATLCDSKRMETSVYLFQMLEPDFYTYAGRVELADKPYVDMQPGEDKKDRMIWVFPLKPVEVEAEALEKPASFVFGSVEEYKANAERVEAEYAKIQATMKRSRPGAIAPRPASTYVQPTKQEVIEIPDDIVGKVVLHKAFGAGTVTGVDGKCIVCNFNETGEKKLGYEICMKNKLISFIDLK